MAVVDELVARGVLPDPLLRAGIRATLAAVLVRERLRPASERRRFLASLAEGPIAPAPELPNAQHYEVPADFFRLCLGPRLKYSSCYWPSGVGTLAEAEEAMLALTCERAGIEDGMDVLDLGCGWGSLALWIGERYPRCRVLAVSNATGQRRYVAEAAGRLGLGNVEAATADVNAFASDRRFDRVVSVEMFEHMRNWEALLRLVASLLRPEGRAFVHVFAHRAHAYPYERGWMARTFFTGGLMPSDGLLAAFPGDLEVVEHRRLSGTHYARTAGAWLANLDANAAAALAVLARTHGPAARRRLAEWRVFFLACAELWAYGGGREWLVTHTLLAPR